jgi:hypothetical protein
MFDWLFGRRLRIRVTILGIVGDRVVRFDAPVSLRGPVTVGGALRAAGRSAQADLLGALAGGAYPSVLLNGERLDLPQGLVIPVTEGDHLTWLMPIAGGCL